MLSLHGGQTSFLDTLFAAVIGQAKAELLGQVVIPKAMGSGWDIHREWGYLGVDILPIPDCFGGEFWEGLCICAPETRGCHGPQAARSQQAFPHRLIFHVASS